MLIPIDGASYIPVNVTWAAREAATVNGKSGTFGQGYEALMVNGPQVRLSRGMTAVGQPVGGTAEGALMVGFTGTLVAGLGRFVEALQVQGLPVRQSFESLTVNAQRAALAAVGRQATVVASSKGVNAASRLTLLTRGAAKVKSPVLALAVNGAHTDAARAGAELKRNNLYRSTLAANVGLARTATVRLAAEVAAGESFLILADLVDAGLIQGPTGAGYYPSQSVIARLTINGSVWPIRSFQFNAPRGSLGATLNIRLAIPTTNPATNLIIGQALTFELGIVGNDGIVRWTPLVDNGLLAGRQINIALRSQAGNNGPADEISISAYDILHDRFSLAPRRGIIMYDPWKIAFHEVEVRPTDALRDEFGNALLPVIEPIAGLTAYTVLSRAYTAQPGSNFIRLAGATFPQLLADIYRGSAAAGTGMGFSAFVTNLRDYPISRADFAPEGSWHEGAARFFSMYGPLYFQQNNILFIIDPKMTLPPNFTPRRIHVSTYSNLGLTNEPLEITNAIILSAKLDAAEVEAGAGIFFTYRFDQERVEPGPPWGEPGYILQETTRKVREMRQRDAPATILAEQVEETTVTVHQQGMAWDGGGGEIMLTHREIQQDFYDGLLKTGHDKRVEGLIIDGQDASLELIEVMREKATIVWKEDPTNPGQSVQARTTTVFTGAVVTTAETRTILGSDGLQHDVFIKRPVLIAQANGLLEEATDDIISYIPIKTIEEVLTPTKGNQVDMVVRVYDHLNGTVSTSITQPRTGSRFPGDLNSAKQRQFIIRDSVSEALIGTRKPIGINAGELPLVRAFDLARRALRLATHPPESLRLNIPGVDFSIQRGTVVSADLRAGLATDNFMIAGYDITGENLGLQGHRITMSCEGVEIIT